MHDMRTLFDSDGPLARAIDGFAVREEQIAMAESVAHALRTRTRLVVEAGTGTGKTFAYLVPALMSGRRVIISTGTRNLQDQLFHRDLPAVARALGMPVRVALLKGRSNYLCLHRLSAAEQQATMRGLKRDVATALPAIRQWALVTRAGDIAEMTRYAEQDPIWPWVTSNRDNCLGTECDEFKRCHLVEARRRAQGADVVIVNHHLLLADLVLKEEGFGDLLPGADAIILDEAHQVPEIAANFLGFSISTRQLQALASDLAVELLQLPNTANVSGSLSQMLDRRAADLRDVFKSGPERREVETWPAEFYDALHGVQAALAEIATDLQPVSEQLPGLGAVRRRAIELNALMRQFEQDDEELTSVRWVQLHRSGASLHLVPVDVADQLGKLLESQSAAWICTSATLAVGDDFSHFLSRIGLNDARTERFDSPFDYASQALLYLPRGMDAPNAPGHTERVVDASMPVLTASGGRAFMLFTSHRALRIAAETLVRRYNGKPPFTVLVQGDAPREALLDEFRRRGNAVLLGTSSFWEGVDVKGPALSVVIIDKLPFAAPDDPVLKARLNAIEQRGGNPFFDEQIPQAAIALKQGVGRLIRDVNDFGVVMLCDGRVQSKGYGRVFLESLPPLKRTRDLEQVETFLSENLSRAAITIASVREATP